MVALIASVATTEPVRGQAVTAVALAACDVAGVGPARCGVIPVSEAPDGDRTIRLNVVVLPATGPDPARDPVFFLAGGPGQGATALAPQFSRLFRTIRRTRDLVFVDQRGTGHSNPLQCSLGPEAEAFQRELQFEVPTSLLRECLSRLDADLRWYATPVAMDDLDQVRAALGYERINLYGGSYGTRAALVYMRRHGEHVRAAVLAGVAPTTMKLPVYFASDAQRALEYVDAECGSSAACRAAYPDLVRAVDETLDRLAADPQTVTARNPATGGSLTIHVTRDVFAGGIRLLLYGGPLTRQLPLVVSRAHDGDFAPFVSTLAPWLAVLNATLYRGMMLTVACAEDAPFIDRAAAARDAEGTFLGNRLTETFLAACAEWPRAWLPEGYSDPVRSSVPALVISTEADPVTPPVRAEEALRHLPNGVHVVVPHTGHVGNIGGCEVGLITRFLESGSARGLDTTCTRRRPPRRFTLP